MNIAAMGVGAQSIMTRQATSCGTLTVLKEDKKVPDEEPTGGISPVLLLAGAALVITVMRRNQ